VNVSRTGALALRIVRGFRHDRRTLALVAIVPLIVMVLIGYLVGDDKESLRVGVVGATLDSEFVRAYDRQRGVTVTATFTNEADAVAALRDGDLDGVVLGAGHESCIHPPDGGVVIEGCVPVIVVGGQDVQVESAIAQAWQLASAQLMDQVIPPGGLPNLEIDRIDLPGGERPSTISYAAPAMVTTFAFLFTFMLTSVAFLRERSSGTLERLLASPITKAEILAGYLLGFLPFAAIQATLVLGYAIVILHAKVAGPFWLVVLVLVLLVVGVVNLGIALSFYARNELQVIQFIPLMLLPQVFLGGLFWPVVTLWEPLRAVSVLFPVTHAVHALRAVMLGGQGLADVAPDLLSLVLFAAAMIGLGVLVLRRQRA